MRRFSLLVLVLVLVALPVSAQTRSSLTGTVIDPSSSAIPGADVTATNDATGEVFRAVTNAEGGFVFPSLPLGTYRVAVEMPGFKKAEVPGVVIQVSIPAAVKIKLEIGEVAQEVTVLAEAQQVVNTVSPVLSNVVSTRQVKDLPLPGRDPMGLARLQAGIAVVGDGTRTASVGGLRGSATNVTQDGINAMDNYVKTDSFFALTAPSLNSTSEFSITTGTVGTDAGRGVAQVRMVTPSGTNKFHGSMFWQHRNDVLNANDFFNNSDGTEREHELQNWFGFTAGGPVIVPKLYDGRDKSFWFFSYEGFRENFSATRTRTVLTPDARKGIFRYRGSDGNLQSVDLLKIGNASALNPVTMKQLSAMPEPNSTRAGDGFNTSGYSYNVVGRDPNDKISVRVDQHLFDAKGSSHKLEWVLHRAHFLLTPDTFNSIEAPFPGGINAFQESTRWLTAAAIQSTFGTSITNEVRYGHQRSPVGFWRDSAPTTPFFINLGTESGVTDYDNTFMSQGRNTVVYQFLDNFSWVKGRHMFRFGAVAMSITAITFNDAGIQPTVRTGVNAANPDGILNSAFPNLPSGSTGTAIADRARGVFRDITGWLRDSQQTFNVASPTSGFVPGATRERIFRQREVSFYMQDQWRLRRNFTLSYGLRWEYLGVPTIPNGLAIQPVGGEAGLFGISGPGNLFHPGVLKGTSPTPIDFVSGKTGKPLYGNDNNNFAPFIGFAYSPAFESGPLRWLFGPEGKSSIRAGYSISYLRDGFTVVSNALGTGTTNPGLIQTAANTTPTGVLTTAGVPVTIPAFKMPITDLDNFKINPNNGLWAFNPKLRVPYVQQWSFGIEREILPNTAFEARYVANHAVKIFRAFNFNEVNIFENGFLNEFLGAQKNLKINGGKSFAPGAEGTVALPNMATLFAGLPASSGFGSSTFINNLNNNNVGAMASSIAFGTTYAANRAKLTPNFFVVNPNANFTQLLTNGSFSNYNSLQLEIRRRYSSGVYLQANYTWAKAITDSEGGQSTLESARTLRDLKLDRHISNSNQTHRLIGNFIYEMPFGSGRKFLSGGPSVIGKLVEGWQVGGIVNWQSRPPFMINAGRSTFNSFNTALNGAQLVGMSFEEFKQNLGIYRTGYGVFFINPDLLNVTTDSATGKFKGATLKEGKLGPPDPGKFGNFPRNLLSGPHYFTTDFTLMKRTRFRETANFEFRVTFLNAFNNANFIYNGEVFDDATFGQITGTSGSPRVIHFQLAVNW